ncbi:MAG: type II toxin-antitoxin system ParD family antitoxin [Cognatishimia sp.]|uniref:ribbon-helix-helix domain-containing protein n=1 Tax=Cognatishimia sp. TaxID=2211648 RepID=UPI003B8BF676
MTVKSSISLTDDQFAFAKAMVETGQFSSLSAVLQQGVEILRKKQEDDVLERDALRVLLQQRAKAPTVSADEFDTGLTDMLARKRVAYGLDT